MLKINSTSEKKYYDTRFTENRDIMDNLKYAVGIQSTILPGENRLRSIHPESFIMYRPQSFVSGDFYWMEKTKSGIHLIIGDSTGHGISASFISLITLSALESIKNDPDLLKNPRMVLEYINNHLYRILKKDRGSSILESVEMASINLDFEKMTVQYSSAGINIISCLNGHARKFEKNKTSVGSQCKDSFEIDTFCYPLTPGEKIYLMSDGLKDQHGGKKGKKIGSGKISEILSETSFLPIIFQKKYLVDFLDTWKKDTDQTDDITLIGIKVPEKKLLN